MVGASIVRSAVEDAERGSGTSSECWGAGQVIFDADAIQFIHKRKGA